MQLSVVNSEGCVHGTSLRATSALMAPLVFFLQEKLARKKTLERWASYQEALVVGTWGRRYASFLILAFHQTQQTTSSESRAHHSINALATR